jgi:hypothetical protein
MSRDDASRLLKARQDLKDAESVLEDLKGAQLRDYTYEGDLRREKADHDHGKKDPTKADRCQRLIVSTVARMRTRERTIHSTEKDIRRLKGEVADLERKLR